MGTLSELVRVVLNGVYPPSEDNKKVDENGISDFGSPSLSCKNDSKSGGNAKENCRVSQFLR